MTKKLLVAGLIGLVVGFALASLPFRGHKVGGVVIHNVSESFDAGIEVNGTERISSTGAFTPLSLKLPSGATLLEHGCNTATWNAPSLGTSSVTLAATSTDIALTGAATGDLCVGSLTTATTSLALVGCHISANATATITVVNKSAAALDLDSGTARVCYFGY
jgi:hypothetical protein